MQSATSAFPVAFFTHFAILPNYKKFSNNNKDNKTTPKDGENSHVAETKMAEMPKFLNYPLLTRHWKDLNRGPTVSPTLAHNLKKVRFVGT
jgi:hypothetical protein